MIQPIAILSYKKHITEKNKWSGYIELEEIQGVYVKELVYEPTQGKNKGRKLLGIKPDINKEGALALSNPHLNKHHPSKKNSTHISKLAGMDISENTTIRLWGDIQFVNNPILVEITFNQKTRERIVKIMVFEGGAEKAHTLYDLWLAGAIKESVPDNNITFSTENEQSKEVLL